MKKSWIAALLLCSTSLGLASELDRLAQFMQSGPASAASASMTLGQLLSGLRSKFPQAVVTGRFSDPRSVSIYRSHPGLHYGYDVALPAGAVVPAAWPGEVVAITPWYGQEHGISVVSGQREATYGHLIPLVKSGQHVEVGQPLGIVARDHVDVKMRGPAGEFIDFGAGDAEFTTAVVTPEQRNRQYLQARYQFLKIDQQLARAQSERTRLKQGDAPMDALKLQQSEYSRLYEEGAIARLEYESMRRKLDRSLQQAQSKPARLRSLATRISQLKADLAGARSQLTLASRDVNVQAAGKYLEAYLQNHPSVAHKPTMKLAPLRPDLDELLAEGVISRQEYHKMGGASH